MIRQCIAKIDPDIKEEMMQSIFLTGGTSSLPGLEKRLSEELIKNKKECIVKTLKKNRYSPFVAASILSKLRACDEMFYTQYEWEEGGPGRYLQKFA